MNVVFKVYRNGEFMKGQTWFGKDAAIDCMEIEMSCELEDLQKTRPDSQFTITIDKEEGIGTIDEYYYDETYKENIWIFDVSKYEVKECIRN